MHLPTHRAADTKNASSIGLLHRSVWLVLALVAVSGVLGLSQVQAPAATQPTQRIQALSYLEDPGGDKTYSEVLKERGSFTKTTEESLNFGLTQSAYWIWIALQNPDATLTSVLLEVGYPHLDSLDIYQLDKHKTPLKVELGDLLPFSTRPIKDRKYLIPVHFTDNNQHTQLLLRVESRGPVQLPLSVKTQSEYRSSSRNEQLILGLYYGILLGVLAYNFLLALGLKEPVYGYYCGFAVCQALFQFAQNGLAFEYLWPDWTTLNQMALPILASLSLLLATRFTKLFLSITRGNSPTLFAGFCAAELMFVALSLATLLADKTLAIKMAATACSLGAVFLFVTALITFIRGDQNAKFYLVAWTFLIIGVVIYSMKAIGIIPESFLSVHAVQIGSVLEMILLSYALADRFNRLRDENIDVQNEAKATLEKNVENRTRQLNDTLQKLQLANQQLESINQRDPLTNIYNRRFFNKKLGDVWNRTTSDVKPLSLMMIDIDHFKSINDTKGHLIGDEVIMKLASLIEILCKDTNCIPARFGGEEFVVLLPGLDSHSTFRMAEKLRKEAEALTFSVNLPTGHPKELPKQPSGTIETLEFGITISLGMSTYTPASSCAKSGLDLVDQADQALYNAKQSGRNRSCQYSQGNTHIGKAA
ncbi:MAG: diguanylate cyclase [Granulosicoccus sp.]